MEDLGFIVTNWDDNGEDSEGDEGYDHDDDYINNEIVVDDDDKSNDDPIVICVTV